MKKLFFCLVLMSSMPICGMHEGRGPGALEWFKRQCCLSGHCLCPGFVCEHTGKSKIVEAKPPPQPRHNKSFRN